MEPLDGKRLLRILLHFIFMLRKHYQKGVAWGGGIFINPEGIIEYRYAWGLGWKKNNQAKAYGLFLGLTFAQKKGIKTIQVLGNSMIIIRHMIYASSAKNTTLNQIIKRSQGLIPSFELVSFFHSLRGNNQEADKQANHAYQLREERSIVNEVAGMTSIPKVCWWDTNSGLWRFLLALQGS